MAYRSQWGVFFRPTDLDLSAAIPQSATLNRREAETLYHMIIGFQLRRAERVLAFATAATVVEFTIGGFPQKA